MTLVQTVYILQKDQWEQNVVKQENKQTQPLLDSNSIKDKKAPVLLHNKNKTKRGKKE